MEGGVRVFENRLNRRTVLERRNGDPAQDKKGSKLWTLTGLT